MRTVFEMYDLADVVAGVSASDADAKTARINDARTRGLILPTPDDATLGLVAHHKTAYAMWAALESQFGASQPLAEPPSY
ncbi:hypothetical protein HK100_008096 [Physocladia obscura]|uniref:Uncharacterized protein n=1 Tax=Physocladia obscura TaxID=109957 RepID=A0AAD5SQ22_9FUNG|nr:hypothetical protein HK100_008096 [Physocladia obscura]